jgi:hypothetical protein
MRSKNKFPGIEKMEIKISKMFSFFQKWKKACPSRLTQ